MGRPGAARGRLLIPISQNQLSFFSGHPHHRKRAALALTQGFEHIERLGRNGQHVALLAFVAPDFLGGQAGFFQRHGAQIKACPPPGVVGQLGESVGQAPGTDIVNRQNGIVLALNPAVVDDLLCAPLNLGVAALHRVKIQRCRVGTGGH